MTLIQRAWAITILPAATGIIVAIVLGALCLDIESEAEAHTRRVVQLTTYARLGALYLSQLETLLYWSFAGGGKDTVTKIRGLQSSADAKLATVEELVKGDAELSIIRTNMRTAHVQLEHAVNVLIPADPPETIFLPLDLKRKLFADYSRTRIPFQAMFQILTGRSEKAVTEIERKSTNASYIVAAGFLVNLILCIVLLHFFSRHVAGRISSLQRRAKALTANKTLEPMLRGDDEIKRIEVKLDSLSKELAMARRRKQDFLAMVSHDLRSPLTSLGMSLEMFGKGVYGDISVEGRRGFRRHARGVDSLVTMISDVLDLEKIEANLFESNKKNTSLNSLLSSFSEKVSEQMITDRIKVTPYTKETTVFCDADQIDTALTRIVSFCLFASEGEITIEGSSLDDATSPCTVTVEAHSPIECGVDKSDPFNRFATNQEQSGSSLAPEHRHGLALARQLVTLNGQQLTVTFESKTTRFQMRFQKVATAIPSGGS